MTWRRLSTTTTGAQPRYCCAKRDRLVEERGDDLARWQAAWAAGERPAGYRRRALYTLLMLKGLAGQSPADLTQRQRESALGLGLLTQLSVESDDQASL